MLAMDNLNIGDWLHREMVKRNWSQADLSRAANLSPAAVSNLISGKRSIGKDAALLLSRAFNIPLDDVLRAAGDLPSISDASARSRQVAYLLRQLPEDEHEDVVEYILLRLKIVERKNAPKANGIIGGTE